MLHPSLKSSRQFPQALDRTALIVIGVLSVMIAGLLLLGDRTAAHVRSFSWDDKRVGAEDTAFILDFSRPMDRESVESNLHLEAIVPDEEPQPIPGKFSWAGRRMAYTLDAPAPYGYEFELTLEGAHDRFSVLGDDSSTIRPFKSRFHTRDRAFLYLGTNDDETGRLILYNITRQEKRLLTPETLVVMDYEAYPEGDRVLFSATNRESYEQGLLNQQLYTVSTGIRAESSADTPGTHSNTLVPSKLPESIPAEGEIKLVLDDDDYQNLKFDLSPDGQTIVVYRVNRSNPAEFGLWSIGSDGQPKPLESEPGGDFLITPDSQALAYLQGEGLAILPLNAEDDDTNEPLEFLPTYGMVLSFASDGSAAALVKFNADPYNPTRSLYLVTNQGAEKELLKTTGSILNATFDPTKTRLFCLLTELLPGDVYVEQPYLTAIDLETGERIDLLQLPIQQDIQMSLAPDGLGILFDQVVAASEPTSDNEAIRGIDGKPIATSRLWFLPVLTDENENLVQTEPEVLPFVGLRPRWLP
ncbi:MAG: hypothetical protein ACFE0J_06985 [Elainellaceae cyanobacterium]